MAIPRALLAFGVGFLMLALVVSAPNAAALNESMDVITLPGFSTTTLGATVTLTTHVFQYGSHADATSLTVSTFARTLTATRTSTGVYETTFTIQATDVYGGYVYVNVGAWIGTLFDYGYAYLQLGPWFALDLTTSATHASPGDTVDVTARFTENGTLLDPNTIVVRASLAVPGAATITQDLTLTHPATGTYVGSFTVPPTLAQEGRVSFGGNAERSGFYAYDSETIGAGTPGVASVWFRLASVGASSSAIDVFVANATGWPVAGALVVSTYEYQTTTGTETGSSSATADASGVARLTFAHPGALYEVSFRGTATSGSLSAGFSGYVNPPYTGVVVLGDPESSVYAPGSAVSLGATVYLDGNPVTGRTVYYYARTGSSILASGQTATDADGRITLSFLMPSEDLSIDYAVDVGGTWYSRYGYVSSHPFTVTHNTVHAGSLLQVSVPSFPVPMRYVVFVLQGRISGASYQSTWSLASGSLSSRDIVLPTGPSVQFSLQLPRALPKGQDYFLTVYGVPQTLNAPPRYYVDTIHIENVPPVAAAVPSASSPAVGESVRVNASSSTDADGAIVAYRFAWGDGATTNWTSNASAAHAYANPGDYTVTVSVRDDNGAEQSTTLTVRVQSSTAVLLYAGLGLGAAAVAGVAVFLWRRSRRPPATTAPEGALPPIPASPEGPPARPPGAPPPPPL